MQVIQSEFIIHCDIDDTLVMWNNVEYWHPGPEQIEFIDPYDNRSLYLKPHKDHIALLKKYKAQGFTIFVWSAGGYKWAESVVKTLQLENTVDFVMSKNTKFVDDLPASQVLGTRIFIPFEQINRNIEPGEKE